MRSMFRTRLGRVGSAYLHVGGSVGDETDTAVMRGDVGLTFGDIGIFRRNIGLFWGNVGLC